MKFEPCLLLSKLFMTKQCLQNEVLSHFFHFTKLFMANKENVQHYKNRRAAES